MSGNAIALAARKVREKALRIAARRARGGPAGPGDRRRHGAGQGVAADIEISLATVAVLSNPLRYAFDEASKQATQFAGNVDYDRPPVPEDEEPGLEGTDYYSPIRSTFANGMHAAIVETDPETAEIRILRYCVVHDCGTLINPRIVEGQVHGGVAQGVGGALYERMVYDEHGQLLNASFMDFLMPYATEVPVVEIDHLETPSPLNPLGIKGAGEAGVIPGMAVIAAAIEDAEGFRITRMPISPSELFDLRRRHAAGEIPALRRTSREGVMKVTGSATIAAPRDEVWTALNDPAVLVRTIPGCLAAGGDRARRLPDDDLRRRRVDQGHLPGRGPAGRAAAARLVRAARHRHRRAGHRQRRRHGPAHAGGCVGTRIDYDADAVVGGMIGGVGQRVLAGVAKKTAGEFFAAVERRAHRRCCQRGSRPPPALLSDQAAGASQRVFEAPASARGPRASVLGAGLARRPGRGGHRLARGTRGRLDRRSAATVMRAFTAAALQVAPRAEPLPARDDRGQRLGRRRLGAAMRGGVRRRTDRAAGNSDHRVLPGLLGGGALGSGDAVPRRSSRSAQVAPRSSAFTWSGGRTTQGPERGVVLQCGADRRPLR